MRKRGDTVETTVLIMYFIDAVGKKVSISVAEPKLNLTPQEVEVAMDGIISNNIFDSKMNDLVAKHSAQIVTRTVEVLDEY